MSVSASDELLLKSESFQHLKTTISNDKHGKGAEPPSTNPPLPRGCRPLAHQVAGHRYGKGRLGIGMLQHFDGSILKPLQPPPRGEREANHYKRVFDPTCDDPVLLTLRPFLPKLLGVWTPPVTQQHEAGGGEAAGDGPPKYSYLKLEDVCKRFRNPSILDIKIGRVSYDPSADAAKRKVEVAKYPPLSELGFQLLGMRVSGMSPNEAVFYDKHYGRSLSEDRITEGLDLFLSGNLAWKKYIVKAFVQRLEMILSWFESQERYQFYASSLLLIYEGEFVDGSSDSDEEFIHKCRQLQLPTHHNTESYLATVRRFLSNNNADEDRSSADVSRDMTKNAADDTLMTKPEVTSPTVEKRPAATNGDDVIVERKSDDVTTGENREATKEDGGNEAVTIATTTTTSPSRDSNVDRHRATGLESGYSSEAESKKKKKSQVEQREFVTQLNRRIQECGGSHNKYRFPPEIVDVRMIDFAHVYEEQRPDENYIYGLRNLLRHFRVILKQL